jgi:hypothetical protein
MAGKATSKFERKRFPKLLLDAREIQAIKKGSVVREKQLRKELTDQQSLHEKEVGSLKVRHIQELAAASKSSAAARVALHAALVANEEMNVSELLAKQAEWKDAVEKIENLCRIRVETLESAHKVILDEKREQYSATVDTLKRLHLSESKKINDDHDKEIGGLKTQHANEMAAKAAESLATLGEHNSAQLAAHTDRENEHALAVADANRAAVQKLKDQSDRALQRQKANYEAQIAELKAGILRSRTKDTSSPKQSSSEWPGRGDQDLSSEHGGENNNKNTQGAIVEKEPSTMTRDQAEENENHKEVGVRRKGRDNDHDDHEEESRGNVAHKQKPALTHPTAVTLGVSAADGNSSANLSRLKLAPLPLPGLPRSSSSSSRPPPINF